MPKKSVINRGIYKLDKLRARIVTTLKAQYPDMPREYLEVLASQHVAKYAQQLGYYEGTWRAFKRYLEKVGTKVNVRLIQGPLRSAVIHLARLEASGATPEEMKNYIDTTGFPDDVRTLLKEFFVEEKRQTQQ